MRNPPAMVHTGTTGLRGLAWDHPRVYAPLEELARLDASLPAGCETVGLPLRWERKPAAAFESMPVSGYTDDYDILVVAHPGLGSAVESGSLMPMESLFTPTELNSWQRRSVGASYESYRLDGRTWALPLDAATQLAALRPDLVDRRHPPRTWDEVCALAQHVPVALCLGGPHAFLTLCALSLAQGEDPMREDPGPVVPRSTGLAALDMMAGLRASTPPPLRTADPSGVLRAMAHGTGPAYCPLVYGDAACTWSGAYPLAFSRPPGWRPGGPAGSVLGGAGLAVSAGRVRDAGTRAAVRDHLRRLLSDPVQRELLPMTGGQPAARSAWTGRSGDRHWRDFSRDTLNTVEDAWLRPRRPGFLAFQEHASELLRDGLEAGTPHPALLDALDTWYRRGSWR
ncbi:extracellular solute-binding protein [Streptomyces sp. NBC_01166]|uniref:extracellular solute-binding protein n=1 Tax=Streptomyces sp. NBC_01166 TaxID=2903755 RepID=UPI0038688B82|nr:extracellular solute-binding protein [Streptomyces sp. NBC_01166]